MKNIKYLIIFVTTFLLLLPGCSNENSNKIKIDGNVIVIQERINEEDNYVDFKEITDKSSIQKIKGIIDNISWENAVVDMAHPPSYKFFFENGDEQTQNNELVFDLWISPGKEKIELVIETESKYVQLNKEKSEELFQLLIGEKLKD